MSFLNWLINSAQDLIEDSAKRQSNAAKRASQNSDFSEKQQDLLKQKSENCSDLATRFKDRRATRNNS